MDKNIVSQKADESRTLWVTKEQLPISCPTPEMNLWNSHPRVFLSIEQQGHATCPYCGTKFLLKGKYAAP